MKSLMVLAALALTLVSHMAGARDSSWVLCENGKLVINALEHRAGASARATEYTMIFGARVLQGTLPDSRTRVTLTQSSAKLASNFKGTLVMSTDLSQVKVKGVLTLDGETYESIDTTIACKDMDNN